MLVIASDHGGFELKQVIMAHLEKKGIAFEDVGTYSTDSVDYPEYGALAARGVASGKYEKGIVICGTGIGISIAANKVHGIRCALCGDCYSAEMTRAHNDANMLALGGRVTGPDLACKIVDTFLSSEFLGGRHERRVAKLAVIEAEG